MLGERGSNDAMLSIAMVGTRGVPARYGGFETAVEEVGRRFRKNVAEMVAPPFAELEILLAW